MASSEVKFGADVNWPVVAGVGIIAVFAFYLLYSVNNTLTQVESVTTAPLAGLESGVGSLLSWLNPSNWFSGSSDGSGQ
jgi:hypothetical protein